MVENWLKYWLRNLIFFFYFLGCKISILSWWLVWFSIIHTTFIEKNKFILNILKKKRKIFAKIEKNIVFSYENMEKKSRTMNFSPKSYALIWDFQNISKIKSFYPNLRLRVCLAMCLIFQQSEPSVLINCVLTEKKMCNNNYCILQAFFYLRAPFLISSHMQATL